MKKLFRGLFLTLGILILIYLVSSFTGIFTIYNNPTTNNSPTLRLNSKIVASNLVTPQNGDFICYKSQTGILGNYTRIHRLCGKENDVIEIKNGILFINDKNVDSGKDLMHLYVLTKDEYQVVKPNRHPDVRYDVTMDQQEDSIMVLLPNNFAKNNGFELRRRKDKVQEENKYIQEIFHQEWTFNNFGPLKIPKNKVFVLGDNRDIAEDSRLVGLIDKSDIIGTVILK